VTRIYKVEKDRGAELLKFWENETRSPQGTGAVVEPGVVVIVDKRSYLDWLEEHFDGLK